MNCLVISMDNEVGKLRREHLNYEYTHIKGVSVEDEEGKFVRDNLKVAYNTGDKIKNGISGCFSSHIKCLKYIIENKLDNTIILEDDSIKVNDFPVEELPQDAPTFFAGRIAHPTNWKYNKKFVKEEADNIISNFKKGINLIDREKFRVHTSSAIYFPNIKVAEELLNYILTIRMYKHYDLYLSKYNLVKYLYYPSIFKHDDSLSGSNYDTRRKAIIINNYKVIE